MIDRYILRDGKPVPEPDLEAWGNWYKDHFEERVVKQTQIGESQVSTVFLALDHSWSIHSAIVQTGTSAPVLWETLVFGGPLDGEMLRYSSREDAEKGHEQMCQRVREAQQE